MDMLGAGGGDMIRGRASTSPIDRIKPPTPKIEEKKVETSKSKFETPEFKAKVQDFVSKTDTEILQLKAKLSKAETKGDAGQVDSLKLALNKITEKKTNFAQAKIQEGVRTHKELKSDTPDVYVDRMTKGMSDNEKSEWFDGKTVALAWSMTAESIEKDEAFTSGAIKVVDNAQEKQGFSQSITYQFLHKHPRAKYRLQSHDHHVNKDQSCRKVTIYGPMGKPIEVTSTPGQAGEGISFLKGLPSDKTAILFFEVKQGSEGLRERSRITDVQTENFYFKMESAGVDKGETAEHTFNYVEHLVSAGKKDSPFDVHSEQISDETKAFVEHVLDAFDEQIRDVEDGDKKDEMLDQYETLRGRASTIGQGEVMGLIEQHNLDSVISDGEKKNIYNKMKLRRQADVASGVAGKILRSENEVLGSTLDWHPKGEAGPAALVSPRGGERGRAPSFSGGKGLTLKQKRAISESPPSTPSSSPPSSPETSRKKGVQIAEGTGAKDSIKLKKEKSSTRLGSFIKKNKT